MSWQRPVIILFKDGAEAWFPSIKEGAKAVGCAAETLRQFINYKGARRSRYKILGAWWSDWDRNKL